MRDQATRPRRQLVDEKGDEDREERAADAPRQRRRIDRDDDQDERSRPRRRDEQDDERPRSRRRDEDEDEQRPRRGRADEEEDRPRSRRRDEEEDDRSRSRRRGDDEPERAGRGGREKGAANGGWGAAKAVMDESGNYPRPLKFSAEPILVKALQDEPFDACRTHWIEECKGRKKFRCLKSGCPLCDPFGDETNGSSIFFNVVSFEDPHTPTFAFIEAGARLSRALEAIGEDDRYRGLADPNLYLAISVTGPKKTPEYHVEPVKKRDVFDDWDVDPLTDGELDVFERKMYTGPVEPPPTRSELQDLVKELTSPRR